MTHVRRVPRWRRQSSYFRLISDVKRHAMIRLPVRLILALFGTACALHAFPTRPMAAQFGAVPMQISWEVRNRFRLFREERDFLLPAETSRGRTVLATEQALAIQSDGRGW